MFITKTFIIKNKKDEIESETKTMVKCVLYHRLNRLRKINIIITSIHFVDNIESYAFCLVYFKG